MTPYKILLVDDVPGNLKILEASISSDYELFMATSGAKALKIVATNPPDLILLDIEMPEMSGLEVLERLRADESTRGIPVVFLTSKDTSEDIVQGLKAGAYYYLTKPFDTEMLRLVIAQALADDNAYDSALRDMQNSAATMKWLNHLTHGDPSSA
ncbi:MAG: response regulator [Magnetococcales bacterium]|nr:response regulator [Magnetococcales bacterium]